MLNKEICFPKIEVEKDNFQKHFNVNWQSVNLILNQCNLSLQLFLQTVNICILAARNKC